MANTKTSTKGNVQREVVISRILNAKRENVFKAWTDPKYVSQWWGPHGFTIPVCEMDFRTGGAFRIVMHGTDGIDYPAKGIYREIVEPELIVMSVDTSDHPATWKETLYREIPHSEDKPSLDGIATVSFEDRGSKTLIMIRSQFENQAVRDAFLKTGMEDGWSQSLERLENLVHRI